MDKTDCEWADWSEWEKCTKTCGGGLRTKTRNVAVRASDGGKECVGSPKVTQACNVLDCPVDCTWTEWEDWSKCSKQCDFGHQSRTRAVSQEARYGGDNCSGNATEIKPCNSFGCPVDCLWGGWGGWTACSRACGGGRRERTRPVVTEKKYAGKSCKGNATQREACNEMPCPVDCVWDEWGGWDKCSKPCGNGTASRKRSVKVRAAHEGKQCEGLGREEKECNPQPCPVDCEWTDWSGWGSCTATCGGATRARNRTKVSESQFGGADCTGADSQQEPCATSPCSVDCSWQDWGPWQACICGAGKKYRTREMNLETNGGQSCPDKDTGGMEKTTCDPSEACVSAVKAVDYGNGTKPETTPNETKPGADNGTTVSSKSGPGPLDAADGTKPDTNKPVEKTGIPSAGDGSETKAASGTKPDADDGTQADAASETKPDGANGSADEPKGSLNGTAEAGADDPNATKEFGVNDSIVGGSNASSTSGTNSSGTTSSDTSSDTDSSDTDSSGTSSSANASAAGGADRPPTGRANASSGGSSAGAAPNATEEAVGSGASTTTGSGASGFSGQVVGSIRLTVGQGEASTLVGESTAAAAMREAVAGLAGVPPALVQANLTVLPNGSVAVEFTVEMSEVSRVGYADEQSFAQALAKKDKADIQEEVTLALAKHNLDYAVQVQAIRAEAQTAAVQNSGAATAARAWWGGLLLVAAAAAVTAPLPS